MSVKVAIIGCGAITRFRHAPEYFKNNNSTIVAFCDPLIERAYEFTSIYAGEAFTDYKEIINRSDIDAVSVCTSNATHASVSIEALNAGKHVLCEKPMAIAIEETKNMIEAAKRNNKILMIGHNQRMAPAHKKAKEILKRGDLGKAITFKTSFKHGGPEGWSADKGKHTWFLNKNAAFFGVLGDLGIHKVDLIRWLFDDEITNVNAEVCTLEKTDDKGNLVEVDDNALCILKTSGGIIGTMQVSWTNYGVVDDSTIIYCEKGVIKMYAHPEYDLIIESKDGGKAYYNLSETQKNGSGIIDSFIDSIVHNHPSEIPGEEGFKSLAVIMACIESSQKKSWVLPNINFLTRGDL